MGDDDRVDIGLAVLQRQGQAMVAVDDVVLAVELVELDRRQRLLYEGKAVPLKEVQQAEGALAAAENDRRSAEVALEAARSRLRILGKTDQEIAEFEEKGTINPATPIYAPIGGTIVTFDRALGQAVKPDEKLFGLHDLSRPLLQGHVSERDIASVRIGHDVRVRLTADPGFLAEGKVVRTGRVFGGDNRTLTVWVELSRSPEQGLLHGQLARLTLTLDRPAATPAVPLAAVVAEGTRNYVFVRRDDGTFDRRAVELGRADDRRVEVVGAVREGEPVAVRGAGELQTAFAGVR